MHQFAPSTVSAEPFQLLKQIDIYNMGINMTSHVLFGGLLTKPDEKFERDSTNALCTNQCRTKCFTSSTKNTRTFFNYDAVLQGRIKFNKQ
jgi:hypothetical protein